MDIDEFQEWKTKIDKCSHEDLGRILRFAKPGEYPFLVTGTRENDELWKYFQDRWNSFGGWNPILSKKIGLDK